MVKFPIGVQDFESLIKDGFSYVDKTRQIYDLSCMGRYYFLSRPRRFGKSLLLSTMEAYFLGKKELFKGLAIEKLETEWKKYPVLYLDLNTGKYIEEGSLIERLDITLSKWEAEFGLGDKEGMSLPYRFENVIRTACEATGEKVVILIDEYDKPLFQTIETQNALLHDSHRATLKAFYSVMKTCDKYIRFAFLTGVTKFGKVSVFSDLNNLMDISMDERYVDICGLTEQEIRDNFDNEVQDLARKNEMDEADCYTELRRMYDGYHFRQGSVGIYNPFSVLRALDSKSLESYWFETGTPSFLVELLKESEYELSDLSGIPVDKDMLSGLEMVHVNPIPIIYQSGYLTIRDYDKEMGLYYLDYPNEEVKSGFLKFLLSYYTTARKGEGVFYIRNLKKAANEGDPQSFIDVLKNFFDSGDYRVAGRAELYFQNAMYLIFKLLGLYVNVETATARGRIDVVVKTRDYIYLIELKYDKSAEEALSQIESKGYALKFSSDPRKLFKIGINFSSQTRGISEYKVAE